MIETVRRCVCDDCNKTGPEALESEDPVELAKSGGWKVRPINGEAETVCPKCFAAILALDN